MIQLQNLISRIALIRLGDLSVPRREEGQTLVEYALILFLIAVVVVVIVGTLGSRVSSVFNQIANSI
jgi:pilus assembly protein Flp/PilA